MCNLETEGTQHGCGHYRATRTIRKLDCGDKYCQHSSAHPSPCPHCQENNCRMYLGPDRKEVVKLTTADYCPHCQYWYRGPGAVPR